MVKNIHSRKFIIGIDFGTDSVRSVVIDTSDGNEIAGSVVMYPRWSKGYYCEPQDNQFRQHPLDYMKSMEMTIKDVISQSPKGIAENIVGIGIDTTGSTPVAVNKEGIPLSLTPGFESNPNAMFVLWKDHTAVSEAEEINDTAKNWGGIDYTKYVGGVYSSEWFWAKILYILRNDKKVREEAYSWVEHCDWIPALLTGNTDPLTIKRSRCAAGHKAMWHESFGGLPAEEFLVKVDPLLGGLRNRLYGNTCTVNIPAGKISPDWADKLGLPQNVVVGTGAFDAHLGAVGAEIESNILCKVMGTSTCDMLVAPLEDIGDKLIEGICGQVDGSIIPGMLGMEAGQSAFGDVFAWFKSLLSEPVENVIRKSTSIKESGKDTLINEILNGILPELSNEADRLPLSESNIVALDWFNGRRTPYANQRLKGVLSGLSLGSNAPGIFRALVESTAFGAKKIVERFVSEGIPINGVIALGGIPKKSPFIMQVAADVLNISIKISRSEQTCALGAAMAAAVAAGVYSTIYEAQKAMGSGFESEYFPNSENTEKYDFLYGKYNKLGRFVEDEFVW